MRMCRAIYRHPIGVKVTGPNSPWEDPNSEEINGKIRDKIRQFFPRGRGRFLGRITWGNYELTKTSKEKGPIICRKQGAIGGSRNGYRKHGHTWVILSRITLNSQHKKEEAWKIRSMKVQVQTGKGKYYNTHKIKQFYSRKKEFGDLTKGNIQGHTREFSIPFRNNSRKSPTFFGVDPLRCKTKEWGKTQLM